MKEPASSVDSLVCGVSLRCIALPSHASIPSHQHHMARTSTKTIQDLDITFETGDGDITKTFTLKWVRTGNEPGKFMIEGQELDFNGQVVPMGKIQGTDISNMVELVRNSVQNKIKKEALTYSAFLNLNLATRVRELIHDKDDVVRSYHSGGMSEHTASQNLVYYLAVNSRGNTYQADNLCGTRARLLTAEKAAGMRKLLAPITEDEVYRIRELCSQYRQVFDQELNSCYATFYKSCEAALTDLFNNARASKEQSEQAEATNINFTTVIDRYIK